MFKKVAAIAVAFAAAGLAACAGHTGSTASGNSFVLPQMPDLRFTATLPSGLTKSVMEELPSEGLGTVSDPFWKATLGGFTQTKYSQALGFPPRTKLTITNISSSIQHTLNVVKKVAGPPAHFPSNPSLGFSPSGGKLQKGYRSGIIQPGKSVTVTLGRPGNYLFGCAFHYHEGMQDVFVIHAGATPGPQGTPPAQ